MLDPNMRIGKAEYIASYEKLEQCPKGNKPEFAFIGRSNVGKSTMINMLTGQSSLAKVSKSPGKTKLLNFFNIEDRWYLVDLPGFGYAKVSKKQRTKFKSMVEGYIINREQLACTFMLVDISISPQKIDLEFIDWMGSQGVPFCIVFTKSDKANQVTLKKNLQDFETEMLKRWESMPQSFLTSSTKGKGRDELLTFIREIIEEKI